MKAGRSFSANREGGFLLRKEMSFMNDHPMVVRCTSPAQFMAIGFSRGGIRIYSITGLNMTLVNFLKPESENLAVTDMKFIQKNDKETTETKTLIATYVSGYVRLWAFNVPKEGNPLLYEWFEIEDQTHLRHSEYYTNENHKNKKPELNQIFAITISANNKRFATGGSDAIIRVYEFNQTGNITHLKTRLHSETVEGHTSKIMCVKYHPLGEKEPDLRHMLISGSWDGTIQIWDDQQGASVWKYFGPLICSNDAIDIDLQLIYTGSWVKTIGNVEIWPIPPTLLGAKYEIEMDHVYDYSKSTSIGFTNRSDIATTKIYVVKLFGNGKFLFYAGVNQNLVRIIDLKTHAILGEINNLPSGIHSADCWPDTFIANCFNIVLVSSETFYFCTFRKEEK